MKKWSLVICCSLGVLVFISCSTAGTHTHSLNSQIVGKWQLIHVTGGFAGVNWTPDSTEFTEVHVFFNPDHTFSFFRADTLVGSGKFEVKKEDGRTIIHYKNVDNYVFPDQKINFDSNKTFIISDNKCADCFVKTFKRTN